MAKGQFNNLKGQGKPLPPSKCNPYVDFVTHKINEIMIDNGFAPDWINLQKEIADETNAIKQYLLNERKKLGSLPFDSAEEGKWKKAVDSQRNAVEKLNNKINKFNLVVPVMNKQKMYFNLDKESCDILKKENSTESTLIDENKKEPSRDTEAIFSVVKL